MTDKKLPNLAVLLFGVFALWFAAPFVVSFLIPTTTDSWANQGQFGDVFGSVNALFSGCAFAAFYFTLRLQQQQLQKQDAQFALQQAQLELQREELGLQRKEMEASRAELAKQAAAMEGLARATVAQIRVASLNASIEAAKLKVYENYPRAARTDSVEHVETIAEILAQLAGKIESEMDEV